MHQPRARWWFASGKTGDWRFAIAAGRCRSMRLPNGQRRAAGAIKVVVGEWEDWRLEVRYRGRTMPFDEIAERPAKAVVERKAIVHRKALVPAPSHPWRGPYKELRASSVARQ